MKYKDNPFSLFFFFLNILFNFFIIHILTYLTIENSKPYNYYNNIQFI